MKKNFLFSFEMKQNQFKYFNVYITNRRKFASEKGSRMECREDLVTAENTGKVMGKKRKKIR